MISADATDPMSTQDWPGLAGALCEVVRGDLEFDAGRGGTPGWAAAGAGMAERDGPWRTSQALGRGGGARRHERARARLRPGKNRRGGAERPSEPVADPGNRAAMAMDADGALAPLLVRYVAAFNAGSDAGSRAGRFTANDARIPGHRDDVVLVNLAWLDDDAPLNAPRRPTRRLADAALVR